MSPKINIKKYGHEEGDELIPCPHCKRKYIYFTKWHYEDRPKKKEGRLVIPLELVKTKCYNLPPPMICDKCKLFPKCKDCEIILCNWKKHYSSWSATENPNYCESCWGWRIGSYPQN